MNSPEMTMTFIVSLLRVCLGLKTTRKSVMRNILLQGIVWKLKESYETCNKVWDLPQWLVYIMYLILALYIILEVHFVIIEIYMYVENLDRIDCNIIFIWRHEITAMYESTLGIQRNRLKLHRVDIKRYILILSYR